MDSSETLRIGELVAESYIYGPGKRFVIWLQGCSLHCTGCWNEDLWDFESGQPYTLDHILKLASSIPDLEGISLLGGEPLDQAPNLLSLIIKVKKLGLSIYLSTGYELDEIYSDPLKRTIFDLCDIIISGRYKQELRDLNLKWRGSSNQVITINHNYIDFIDERINQVEIHYSADGKIKIIGYPDEKMINELINHEFNIRETA